MNVVMGRATADAVEGVGALALLARSLKKRAMTEAEAKALGYSKNTVEEVFARGGRPDLGFDGLVLREGISDLATNQNIPRSAKFLRGLESLIGNVAVTARLNPKKTAAVETVLGGLSVAGAGAGETFSPGSPIYGAVGQIATPVAATSLYAVSPGRMFVSAAVEGFSTLVSKSKAVQRELSLSVPKFKAAQQSDPSVDPKSFNLKVSPEGEYTLLNEPNIASRAVTMFSSFGEGRKKKAAEVLVEDIYNRMSQAADADAGSVDEALDGIIARLEQGDVRDLFSNPSFSTFRRMLERQGFDFSAQAEAAKAAGEGEAVTSMDSILGMVEAGLTSNTREGYLLASLLAQKSFEGRMAEDIATRAGQAFAAYQRVLGDGMDSEDAAKALFRALDPLIQSTSNTATNLYKQMPEHRILFRDDAPGLINALTDIEVLPRNEILRGLLPPELKAALRYVEDVRADYTDFQAGAPSLRSFMRDDTALNKAQSKFDTELANNEGPVTDTFQRRIADIDLDSDDAIPQINQIIKDKFEGRSSARGTAHNNRVKNLLRQQVSLLTEKKAALVRAENAVANTNSPDGGIDARDLKEFRTSLLNLARNPNTDSATKRQANELANYFELQLLDETAARDIAPEEATKFLADRAAANAYYNARQNIFNDGIFADIAGSTKQGAPRSVELLREKFGDLKTPTLLYISDVQRASRFAEDPIGTPSYREGALEQRDAVNLKPYEAPILTGLVRPDMPPPSTGAAEHRILSEIENLIVSQRKIPGTVRAMTDPDDVENLLDSAKELGMTLGERNAVGKVISNSAENGLDQLPTLKANLQSMLDEGRSYAAFSGTIAAARKNYADQNLWWAMASGGKSVDFIEIMKAAQRPGMRTRYGTKTVYDNLLEPVKEIERRAADDPRGFLRAIQDENLTTSLDGVDIDRISDDEVAQFITQAKKSAANGLKHLIIDYSRDVAGQNKPSGMNYNLLRRQLFEPLSQENPQPLVTWMKTTGLMTDEQAKNLRNSLDQFVSFEAEMAKDYPEIFQGINPINKALVSTFGSALGGATHRTLSKMTGGLLGGTGGLVAASAGAEAARGLLINARAGAVQDGLLTLMQDEPAQIARFLRMAREGVKLKRPLSGGAARNFIALLTRLQAIHVPRTAAVRAIDTDPLREERPYEPNPGLRERVDPYGDQPPVKNPGLIIGAAPPRTAVPDAVAAAPAQPNPQQRQQYAALFPNDSASGMIRQQQGIGSLMG